MASKEQPPKQQQANASEKSTTASQQLLVDLFTPPPAAALPTENRMATTIPVEEEEEEELNVHQQADELNPAPLVPASNTGEENPPVLPSLPASSRPSSFPAVVPSRAGAQQSDEATPRSSRLTSLFTPPPPPSLQRETTQRISNKLAVVAQGETTALLGASPTIYSNKKEEEEGGDVSSPLREGDRRRSSATDAFLSVKAFRQQQQQHNSEQNAVSFFSSNTQPLSRIQQICQNHLLQPTTVAGAIMFLLYHVVFCLANGSAIRRPHSDNPILGIMAKMSTTGILFAGPVYIYRLGRDIPAIYPSIDLFLAPFLAQAAALVDESLTQQYKNDNGGEGTYPDALFFGSFAVLSAIGMFLAGMLLWLAATFKLANLGTYLPYSVLCGFFSAVGVLLWALAFQVDTAGKTWKTVLFSGDPELMWNSCVHHLPSLIVGILMNRLGPKNPFFVILLIVVTQVCFYVVMWATGTDLQGAQQAQWFWSKEELVYHDDNESSTSGWTMFLPPAPFGSWGAILAGHVNWTAVSQGLGNMAALAFLYLLRSSIHASAMKKNVNNLVRRIPIDKKQKEEEEKEDNFNIGATAAVGNHKGRGYSMLDSVRQSVQIVNMSLANKKTLRMRRSSNFGADVELPSNNQFSKEKADQETEYTEIRANPTQRTLEEIFVEYGNALFVVAGCGGFGCCPTVATSNTMYAIGAESPAPQYGSILLLVIFYLTDFELVKYIPKTAFSSLLVLGAVDTLVVWFFGAFQKTQDIAEWLVVPIIVGFSLFVGFLNAVFLGVGISTFVFVAAFFRVGIVKYNATGLEIRSRIERSMEQSAWLDSNGDYIQVLVLQNYLFFGNASSILSYIATMFEEVDEAQSQRLDFSLPPMPRVLVVDLSLITGMDTSTADIFADIKELCSNNDCKLFLCGLSTRMRKGLALGGVKPESSGPRSKSVVRIFSDLDTALGKAEDTLIQNEMTEIVSDRSPDKNGFRHALQQIDELHGQDFAKGLFDLQRFTVPLELEPGQCLFECDGGVVQDQHRGLFFIESGLLKLERDSSRSLTLTRTRSYPNMQAGALYTLKKQHARMGTMARNAALAKNNRGSLHVSSRPQSLRLARFGPGWVCGTVENASGLRPTGVTTAVTPCRLHHLPFHRMEQMEQEDPILALNLYKMLSHLMVRREEIRVEQLSTLHNILSSPAHSKPISRAAMRAMAS